MANKATLTRTEGYALQDNRTGARLDVDTLITRTAVYHWDHAAEPGSGRRATFASSMRKARCLGMASGGSK